VLSVVLPSIERGSKILSGAPTPALWWHVCLTRNSMSKKQVDSCRLLPCSAASEALSFGFGQADIVWGRAPQQS